MLSERSQAPGYQRQNQHACSATIWMDVSGDQDEICGFAWG
jgi:hypothetical protein